jgi:ABC-type Na+ efflux pump permease subunit
MEMVITSLQTRELVTGKVLGTTLLSLTQIFIWTAGALAAAALALWGKVHLSTLALPWTSLLWGVILIIPAYFLFAFLAAGLGILAGDRQQAQQLAGLVGVLGLAPLWVLGLILTNPEGAVAVGLTIFPLTAPSIALFRMIFGEVPAWQLAISLAVLLLTLAFAIWFVAKIFRSAMLNYGQALGSILGAVNLSGSELVLFVLFGLGGYFLYAGIMAGIGALSPDLESSRTWTFVITLPMLIPIYLWVAITSAPQGPLAITLSLIPFSSPLAMLMRMASATVPVWQVVVSLALLLLTAAGIVWLMARLFRVQTLLSGESFSMSRFWRVLREA